MKHVQTCTIFYKIVHNLKKGLKTKENQLKLSMQKKNAKPT